MFDSMQKRKQIGRVMCCCLSLAAASGCAAIGVRENHGAGKPYAGVRAEAHYLANPSEADYPGLQPLGILDMPFSFVVDTVCLPYDLIKTNDVIKNAIAK